MLVMLIRWLQRRWWRTVLKVRTCSVERQPHIPIRCICLYIQIKCICLYFWLINQLHLNQININQIYVCRYPNWKYICIYHLAKNLFCRGAAISQSDICSHSWLPLSPLVSNIRFQMFPISDIPFKYLSKLIPSPSARSVVNWSGHIQLIIWKMEMSQKI